MILREKNKDIRTADLWLGLIRGIHKGELYYETVPLSILSTNDGKRYTARDYMKEPYGTNTKFAKDCDVIIDLTTRLWAEVVAGHSNHEITTCVPILADVDVLMRINDVSEADSDYDLLRRAVENQLQIYSDHYIDLPESIRERIKFLLKDEVHS